MIKAMLIAGAGGFIGTCGRFIIGKLCKEFFGGSFPFGTLLVNMAGCFIIGILFGLIEKTDIMTSGQSLLLVTGFCGGFTTFSTFAEDMWELGNKGDWIAFGIYLAASVISGILLVWAGRAVIR